MSEQLTDLQLLRSVAKDALADRKELVDAVLRLQAAQAEVDRLVARQRGTACTALT